MEIVQVLADTGAAVGDTVTFGVLRAARQAIGIDNVDYCSFAYAAGTFAGTIASVLDGEGEIAAAAKGGSRVIRVVEGARYPLSPKVQGQLGPRGWTTEAIDEAVRSGQQVRAVNKATGNPATRCIHPKTGQSVVIDDVTGQVIHVGGPGFKYGPASGDIP